MTALIPVKEEVLSPKEFLDASESDASSIKKAKFVPPRLGERGFGSFQVEYKTPKLRKTDLGSF